MNKKEILFVVIMLSLIFFSEGISAWWNNDWNYRKNLTFSASSISENLQNFTVLVQLNSSNFDFSKAKSGGSDLRFVDSDDSIVLNYEVERWDSANQVAEVWVQIPQIDSGSVIDYIWIYYNNSNAIANSTNATWSGWSTVTHLNGSTGGNDYDSVNASFSYLHGGTGSVKSVSGKIGLARYSTDGDVEWLQRAAFGDNKNRTIMAWVYFNNWRDAYGRVFSREDGGGGLDWEVGSGVSYKMRWNPGGSQVDSASAFGLGQWYFITTTINGSTGRIYINGKQDNSGTGLTANLYNNTLYLFKSGKGADRASNATIDEFRIYNGRELSAEWIEAENFSQSNNFITFGNEQEPPISDIEYPTFSSYWDNNASLINSGVALFNVTLLSTNGTVLLEINNQNYTPTNLTSNVFNVSVNLNSNGTYIYRWHAWGNGTSHLYNKSSDRIYTVNYSDLEYPQFSSFTETPSEPLVYSSGQTYEFNVTIISTNGTVGFEFNGTNYTASNISANVFNVSISGLSSGNYTYSWWAYGNGTWKNFNNSVIYSYNISKAVTSGMLTNRTSLTIEYPNSFNFTYSESNAGDEDISYKVYRNNIDVTNEANQNIILEAGIYNYILNSTGGMNYTSNLSISNFTLTVNQNSSYIISLTATTPIIYPATTDFVGSGCPAQLTCSLNISNAIYGAGTISANYSTEGNANYSSASANFTVTINQNNSQCDLYFNKTSPLEYPATFGVFTNCSSAFIMYRNGTEISNGSVQILSAGSNYNFTVLRNDNINYTNIVSNATFTINQNNSYVLSLTGTSPIIYGTASDIVGTSCPSQLICNLSRNNTGLISNPDITILGAGFYNYTYNTTGNQNYSSQIKTFVIEVQQATSITSLTTSPSSSINYGTPSNFSCSNNLGLTTVLYVNGIDKTSENNLNIVREANSTGYNISCITIGNTNYTGSSNETNYIINKSIPIGSLTNDTALTKIWDGIITNVGISENNFGDGDLIYSIFKNNINVGVSNAEGSVGNYNYLLNATGGANYTANNSMSNFTLEITQRTGIVNGFINNTQTNFTAENGSSVLNVYLNATLNSPCIGTGKIYVNGTLHNSGTLPIYNLTNLSVGYYNITFEYDGNSNCTANAKIRWVNVTLTDNIFPNVTINSPLNQSYTTNIINFNITALDETEIDTCKYSLNNGVINYSMTNIGNNWNATNATMSQGSHTATFYCNDTSNNLNNTESIVFFIDSINPSITISYPQNVTYSTNVTSLNYTYTEINKGYCWWSLNNGVTNSSSILMGNNFTNINSAESSNNLIFYCNDTLNNQNQTSITYWQDSIKPNILIAFPTNNTNSTNTGLDINYTRLDTNLASCWYSNDSMSSNSSLENCINLTTIIWSEGQHNATIWVNDSVGNLNFSSVSFRIDSMPPSFVNTTPQNQSITYGTALNYDINASDSGIGLDNYFVNDSRFSINNEGLLKNNTILGVAEYYINITINDTLNNLNSTIILINITKATPILTKYLNGINHNLTIQYPQQINATASATGVIIKIYRDGTDVTSQNGLNLTLGFDYYEYLFNVTGNQNYSDIAGDILYVNVTKATGQTSLIFDKISPQDYGVTINVSCSIISGIGIPILYKDGINVTATENGQNVFLGVDVYNYMCNLSETQNYTSATNLSSFTINQILSQINLTLNQTQNNVTIPLNSAIDLNCSTITGDSGAYLSLYKNNILINNGTSLIGNTTTFSIAQIENITCVYSQTNNYSLSYQNYYVNVSDSVNPSIAFLTEFPQDGVEYSPNQIYRFNATITDDGQLATVMFEFNGTNYTATNLTSNVYNVTIVNLPAGNFSYRWFANDSSSNLNNSETGTYTINKSSTNLNINATPSWNEIYGTSVNINGSGCPSQLVCNLYNNNSGEIINGQNILYKAGIHNFTYNTSGNQNYTRDNVSSLLTIIQATGEVKGTINGTRNNFNEIDIIGTLNIPNIYVNATNSSGYGAGKIYVNGTLYNSGTLPIYNLTNLSVGYYNITFEYDGNENYSSDLEIWWVNITYIDYTNPSITIGKNQTQVEYGYQGIKINWTSSDNEAIDTSQFNITFQNGILIYYSNSNFGEIVLSSANLTQIGIYTITFWVNDTNGNQNLSSTNFVVSDTRPPAIGIIYPLNTTYVSNISELNYTYNDLNSAYCWHSNNSGLNNYSIVFAGTNWSNLSDNEGSNTWKVYCNDSYGNENYSSVNFIRDTINPVVLILYPVEGNYLNYNSGVSLNYSILSDDTDSCWYSLDLGINTSINSCSNITLNLSEGNHKINLWINDSAGLVGSSNTNFTIDLTYPIIELISPLNNTLNTTYRITDFYYNVTDTNEIINCSLIIGNKINKTVNTPGKANTNNLTSYLDTGSYSWNVNCTDVAGNQNKSETRNLRINYTLIVDYSEFDGGTTDFVSMNESELGNLTNIIIEKVSYGRINFLEQINLTQDIEWNVINLSKYVNISSNRIEVDAGSLVSLEKSATLYLYNLTFTNPRILRNGEICSSAICTIENYTNGTLKFNVTGFTTYSAEEIPVSSSSSSSGGGRGGSGGGGMIKPGCQQDSECEKDYVCFKNQCVKLFDVKILDYGNNISSKDFFQLTYYIKGMANIEGDVIIKFWIQNGSNKIELGQDVIYLGNFEEKTEKVKLYLPSELEGIYDLYVQAGYENYKAESFRKIEILYSEKSGWKIFDYNKGEETAKIFSLWNYIRKGIPFIFAVFLVLIIFFIIIYKKSSKMKYAINNLGEINNKMNSLKDMKKNKEISDEDYNAKRNFLSRWRWDILKGKSYLFYFVFIGIFLFAGRFLITGGVIGINSHKNLSFGLFFIILITGIFVLLKMKKLKNEEMNFDFDKDNRVSFLKEKKVYTEDGSYLGRVKEIFLEENKIHSIAIKLENRKINGIILKSEHIKNFGNVVLVSKDVLSKLQLIRLCRK